MTALLIVLANLADFLTFACAASVLPIAGEVNPLARWLYVHHGLLGVVGLKVVGLVVILAVLAGIHDPTIRNVTIAGLVAIALFGALTNTAAVVLSFR